LPRSGQGIGYVHPALNVSGRTGAKRYLTNADVWQVQDVSHTHIPQMHPRLEKARKEIWDRPDEDGKIKKRPTSVGQLLRKFKWEKPLADWIMATGVCLLGNELRDNEAELVERNDGWRREPFI
jgi:hypothetical protein